MFRVFTSSALASSLCVTPTFLNFLNSFFFDFDATYEKSSRLMTRIDGCKWKAWHENADLNIVPMMKTKRKITFHKFHQKRWKQNWSLILLERRWNITRNRFRHNRYYFNDFGKMNVSWILLAKRGNVLL